MEDIEMTYHNHIEELNKINIIEYCLINRAMKKYRIQTGFGYLPESYCHSDWWKYLFEFCKGALDIKKMNTRYVCSKERLEAIDFKIIYDYTFKNI